MPAARGAGGCEKYDSIRFMHPSKRYFVVVAILAVALSLSACSRTTPAAQTQKDELPTGGELAQKLEHATGTQANADVTALATDDVASEQAAQDKQAALLEHKARELADAWLAAQNRGDFAAYSALYAEKMTGVKRAGPRLRRFDRVGWLADRQRMFKYPMQVGIRDVQVRVAGSAVDVELIQTFSQGKFSDEGPKQIVLAGTDDGLKIVREEMLRSTLVGAVAASASQPVALVIQIDNKPYVVIDTKPDPKWGSGRLRGPWESQNFYVLQDAAAAPAAAQWAGRKLTTYDIKGQPCEATVGALQLVAGGTPHFGDVQSWQGQDGEQSRAWSQAAIAKAVWGLSKPILVAPLQANCSPQYAATGEGEIKVFVPTQPSAVQRAAAIAAFRKNRQYQEIQRDYVSNFAGKGQWATAPTVSAYESAGRRFIAVRAEAGDGCGDFLGQHSMLFEVQQEKMKEVRVAAAGYLRIDAIIDADGDGEIELIAAVDDRKMVQGYLRPTSAGLDVASEVSFPFLDCGC